ncbi:DUF530 domain-containing protein [Candidatus Micrarchaeota archaeon]|nr:DUF530 domain-containing protein [Candidatus Micrarchaeota archaeon]MBD3418007.1 DUF530 domain-containing protein [Candidatus Micrarchaeota archaeon]
MNLPSMSLVQQLEDVLKDARPFRKENEGKLEEVRERMITAGFNAPFKGILQKTMEEAKDMDEAEWTDLKKQISYFKQIANLKKYSLARASVALSAHRLSGHFLEMGYADIVEHTPLDGNHIGILMEAGAEGILAYRTIMDRMDMMADVSRCFQVKVKSGGETHTVQIEDKERIDYKVARMFGMEAVVTEVKPSLKRKPIIGSKGTRISLVAAIVNYISKNVEDGLLGKEQGKLREYNQYMRGKGLRPDVRIDQVEGYEEIKKELAKKGVLESKGGEYRMGKEMAKEIDQRKKERRDKILERSTMLLLSPMFKFYLTTPREQRKKSNLYPGMAVVPSNSQIRVFMFLHEADEGLPATSILRKKMEMEEMGVRVDNRKLAAAILLQESEKSPEWIAEFLGMSTGEVNASKVLLKSMEKEGKGGEFLKRIKKD